MCCKMLCEMLRNFLLPHFVTSDDKRTTSVRSRSETNACDAFPLENAVGHQEVLCLLVHLNGQEHAKSVVRHQFQEQIFSFH